MKKQYLVNLSLLLLLGLISYACFITGKAYDLLIENLPFTVNGESKPAMEALHVTIDDQKEPIYLLEGDRMVGTAVGNSHTLRIDVLDQNDSPIPELTRTVKFTIKELGPKRELNVPAFYEKAKKP